MADDTNTQKKSETPTYHVDRLVSEATEFFGVAPHVVAGALAESRKQNFTRAEVEKALKTWHGDAEN